MIPFLLLLIGFKNCLLKANQVSINVPSHAKIIINIIIRHYGLLDSIATNNGFFFISKF